jgi:hypothetical protein
MEDWDGRIGGGGSGRRRGMHGRTLLAMGEHGLRIILTLKSNAPQPEKQGQFPNESGFAEKKRLKTLELTLAVVKCYNLPLNRAVSQPLARTIR